jgi:hypothetical protein
MMRVISSAVVGPFPFYDALDIASEFFDVSHVPTIYNRTDKNNAENEENEGQ